MRTPACAKTCATTEEWSQFASQFANSKHKVNRDWYRFLTDDILPDVLPQLEVPCPLRPRGMSLGQCQSSNRLARWPLEALQAARGTLLQARERARRRNELALPRKRSTRIQSKACAGWESAGI